MPSPHLKAKRLRGWPCRLLYSIRYEYNRINFYAVALQNVLIQLRGEHMVWIVTRHANTDSNVDSVDLPFFEYAPLRAQSDAYYLPEFPSSPILVEYVNS